MTQQERTQIEERIVDVLKTVYDPEIPVDIYNLGMIYKMPPTVLLPNSSWRMSAPRWRVSRASKAPMSISSSNPHGTRT